MKTRHRPIKSLGQNFLIDDRVQQKIVDSPHLQSGDTVIEIGPGRGAITRRILPLVGKLIAVEKDRQLAAFLKGYLRQSNLEIIQEDFLKWDMKPLPDHLIVLANIPYYISTPIIERILAHKDKIQRAYLTVQLEFGERLAAGAGSKDYGSLSCFVQYYADVKVLFKISKGCFYPRPKVDSCFVSLTMKPVPGHGGGQANNESRLFTLIQKAFMQRRKTIVNALKTTVEQKRLTQELERLKINPQARPEDLTLLNYIELSNSLVL